VGMETAPFALLDFSPSVRFFVTFINLYDRIKNIMK